LWPTPFFKRGRDHSIADLLGKAPEFRLNGNASPIVIAHCLTGRPDFRCDGQSSINEKLQHSGVY
jgi:hypothetical protein